MISTIPRSLVLGAILAIGLDTSAFACGVCLLPKGGFGVMHPMSIDVAVATSSAREEGLLAIVSPSTDIGTEVDRWQRIDRFATRCAMAFQGKPAAMMKMLCVDTGVETHFRMTEGRASEIRPAMDKKSTLADVTVVTSEAAIRAISNGTISPTDAVAKGLVHVESASPVPVVFNFQQPVSKVGQVGKPAGVSLLPMAVIILGLALSPALVFLTRLSRKGRRNRRLTDPSIESKARG